MIGLVVSRSVTTSVTFRLKSNRRVTTIQTPKKQLKVGAVSEKCYFPLHYSLFKSRNVSLCCLTSNSGLVKLKNEVLYNFLQVLTIFNKSYISASA